MKVVVSSAGPDVSSAVDPRFGRCRWFVVVDVETGESSSVENTAVASSSGAGPGAANIVANTDAEVVLTGQVGPNATHALNELGLKIYGVPAGTVEDAVAAFVRGECPEINRANVSSHAGFGMGDPVRPTRGPTQPPPAQGGRGQGRGGRGRGRGQLGGGRNRGRG